MKKITLKHLLSVLVLAGFLAVPAIMSAVDTQSPTTIFTGPEGFIDKINTITNWVFAILLIVAALMLIISGILFVTSAGSQEQLKTARIMLINSLIGIAIAVAAKGLVQLIKGVLES